MEQEIKAMWKKIKEEQGIIVLAICFFFNILRYISVFQWVRSANNRFCTHRHKSPKDSFIGGYNFPEIWVLCNITCGIMVYALMVNFQLPKVLGAIFVAFAIMRAFERLQMKEIIATKRGIGFYVCEDAKEKILSEQKKEFLENEVPEFLKKMELYGITIDEVMNMFSLRSKM